jgi:4-alpha-glucanotransferase
MRRGSGILLHISSLPSSFGIGDLGPEAYRFVDFLCETGQSFWQILPLNPTDSGTGSSPYRSSSAFAGNPVLISPELLRDGGWIKPEDIDGYADPDPARVDYQAATVYKNRLFEKVLHRITEKKEKNPDYEKFCTENSAWLEDFSLFHALHDFFQGKLWTEWPEELRDRHPEALQKARAELANSVEREKVLQFLFFSQWSSLRKYCHEKGVHIIGDMPIYVALDSADIWANPGLFKVDGNKNPLFVAGVPPDFFSATGQLWGDPVYDWEASRNSSYAWWFKRIEQNFRVADIVRIDHFRGFSAYWEIPAGEKTAVNGRWVDGPGADFFQALLKRFPTLPLIAEDLGTITPDVRELIHQFDFPGMKVLLFAFDESMPRNPYIPHNHVRNAVVYTGTHDNNTARGWFENEAGEEDKRRLFSYLGREVSSSELPWEMIRMAMTSVTDVAIIPMQDLLGLGQEARMNRPSVAFDNWEWRLGKDRLTEGLRHKLLQITKITGRD